jgi:predicted O-methyltransferase YrrM
MFVPVPSPELFAIALKAASLAFELELEGVMQRCRTAEQQKWIATYPGEHYRLLAAFSRLLQPEAVIEIGTGSGLGTLALLDGCPVSSVVTYDIVPVQKQADAVLDDTIDGWEQRIGDLCDEDYFRSELETLRSADLILMDGPKYGGFEKRVLPRLLKVDYANPRVLLILDDIRLMNMASLWMQLAGVDRCDLSSLGHWSGTGLIGVAKRGA